MGRLEGFAEDCADLSLTGVQVELSVGRTVKHQTTHCLQMKSHAFSRRGQVNPGRDGRLQVHAEFYGDETTQGNLL